MAKKKKTFLPKKIAGVKVPKSVRKGRFGELLASPAGQALLAEAVMAVGAVAGAKKVADDPKARDRLSEVADKFRDAARDTGKTSTEAGGALAYALGEAARSFADALRRRPDGGDDNTTAPEARTEFSAPHEDSKKKPTSSEAAPL